MPISITMKPGFMYLGTTSSSTTQEVAFPNNAPFKTTYPWQSQVSADGSIVGQKTGRSRVTFDLTWDIMNCQTWWDLCNWIETNGMSFYCRYFNFNTGAWQTRRVYVESISCKPYRPAAASSTDHGKPLYLKDCTLSVHDMGEVT